MKKRSFNLFLFLPCFCAASFIGTAIITSCTSNAKTIEHSEVMNKNTDFLNHLVRQQPCDDDLKTESSALDNIFDQILKRYEEDAAFIKRIKASQELWKKAATANIAAIFPNGESLAYGSSQGLCECTFMLKEIRARRLFLNAWVEGIPEGEVCRGSRILKK